MEPRGWFGETYGDGKRVVERRTRPGCRPWRMGLACCAGRMGLWLMGCMMPPVYKRLRGQGDHKALCLANSKAELVAGALGAPCELVSYEAHPAL